MRVVLGASLGLAMAALCVSTAVADDKILGSWSGFYAGAHIGYGWGDSDGHIEGEVEKVFERLVHQAPSGPGGTYTLGNLARDGAHDDDYSTSNRGVLGGFHIGGNLQFNAFVFGVEGDYDWSGVDDTTDIAVRVRPQDVGNVHDEPTPTTSVSSEIDNIGSIRGRIGVANNQWLVYGTAGWAWADASVAVVQHNPMVAKFPDVAFSGGSFSADKSLSGYVYGGGVEYKVMRNLSLRVEALRYDLGSIDYEFASETADNNIEEAEGTQDFKLTQVRAALTVHFTD